jgi:hypothetical protein
MVNRFTQARFLTLTLKHSDTPLTAQVDRLLQCIRELRADKVWKKHVAGGVQAIELTYRRNTERWHVHAHLIITGTYFPRPLILKAWLRVTGDSHIVDIRPIHDRAKAVHYVARYVGKPLDPETWPAAKLREYAHAMKGRRLLQPFGAAFKLDLDDDEDNATEPGTTHICHADQLHARSDAGCRFALKAVEVLSRCSAAMSAIMLVHRDPQNPPEPPTELELQYALDVARIVGNTPEYEQDAALNSLERRTNPGAEPCHAASPAPPSASSLYG